MDVVASILCPVIAEFVPFDIKNTIKLESNLGDLDREMKNLMDLHEDIQHQLDSAAEKDGISETSKEEEWLRRVEDLERKANSTRKNVIEKNNDKVLGWFSDWKWRCRLGRKVVKMLEEVERLQSAGNSETLYISNQLRLRPCLTVTADII